jgi:fermentation-respiration switch protein FrsA (DUF1100 family)
MTGPISIARKRRSIGWTAHPHPGRAIAFSPRIFAITTHLSPPHLVWGVLLLVVLLAIGLCISVLTVGLYLSSPTSTVIGQPPATLPGAEPVEIQSASGSVLAGWWLPAAQRGGGAMVLMHGVRRSRLSMVRRAAELHSHGFSVLLFDFQAHGESPGRHITFGHLEALDAAAAVNFVRGKRPGERIGALGVSLGGAAALLGPEPLHVDTLVLESVYPDIDAALANRLRRSLGPVAGPLFTPLLTSTFKHLLSPILGVRPDDLRPINAIGQIRAPVLIASGTIDAHTPLVEAQALFDRAPEPKRFWAVKGAAHVDLERFDPQSYWQVVLPFLTETLRQKTE